MTNVLLAQRQHDYLIGGVAISIGFVVIMGAVLNSDALFLLPKVERLEIRFGRPWTRWICCMVGLLVMLAGIFAAFGGRLWS